MLDSLGHASHRLSKRHEIELCLKQSETSAPESVVLSTLIGSKVPTLLKARFDFKGREAHWGSVATTLQQRCKHHDYLMP